MKAKTPHTESDRPGNKPVDDEYTAGSPGDDRRNNQPAEIGGRGGLNPTRYGDWEKAGRCIDF